MTDLHGLQAYHADTLDTTTPDEPGQLRTIDLRDNEAKLEARIATLEAQVAALMDQVKRHSWRIGDLETRDIGEL